MRADVADHVTSGVRETLFGLHARVSSASSKPGHLRIVVNSTLISLGGQIITWISTLALTMTYGRFLGATGFGELYLAISLTGLIGFPLEFGFNQQIIREVATTPQRAQRYVSNVLILKLALWGPLCIALMVAAMLLHYSPEERIVVALCGLTLLSTSIGAAFGAMQVALHHNIVPVSGLIIEKVLGTIAAFVILRFFHAGVVPVAIVLLVAASLNASWQALWFYWIEHMAFTFDRVTIREIAKASVPFLLYGALGVIYYRIDTVMLGALDGDTVVGRYGAGYKIFDTLIFLPGLVMSTVMYPLMARLAGNDPKGFRLAIEKSANFLLICGMPLATGFGVAAPAIVGFLYHHQEFARTTLVMEALAPGLVLLYINSIISNIILTRNREKALVWMAAGALVINVSLNALLIPRYHEVAAAGVTSFTELTLLVMGLFVIPRDLIPLGSLPTLGKTIVASASMALVILALERFSILVIIPVAIGAYAATGVIVRLIPREDALALVTALRRKAGRQAATKSSVGLSEAIRVGPLTSLEPVITPATVRAGNRRRTPRPTPLAEIYALSSPSERARLVTWRGGAKPGPLAGRIRHRASAPQPARRARPSPRHSSNDTVRNLSRPQLLAQRVVA